MDIFSSQWLINMLAKSSKHPQERLLSLFDILQDWQNAPNIQFEIDQKETATQGLIAFFTEQAKACGAANPEMLAEHIVLIARNAVQHAQHQPHAANFSNAKKAAHALILAQTQKEALLYKPAVWGIAASLSLAIGLGALWLPSYLHPQTATIPVVMDTSTGEVAHTKTITAHDAARMYAKYEQMRNGTCQFPEALQIPDQHKSIYLDNVVGGKLPTDLEHLAIANYYLEKVRCNYTPMLMANSR